jgi:hypothetical protein
MTPDEIHTAVADGSFFSRLMNEVIIRKERTPHDGKFNVTLEFPSWFDEYLDPETKTMIRNKILLNIGRIMEEVSPGAKVVDACSTF